MTGLELFLLFSGLLIGSGIDAAADRYSRNLPWIALRSHCPACQRTLASYEIVPLVSWALLRGRCRTCKAPIGWRPPLMEVAGALVALAAIVLTPPAMVYGVWFSLAFGWLLLALAAIDLRTFILPDSLNAALLLIGGLMVFATRPEAWPFHLAGAVFGYGLLWLVEISYRRIRGVDGLGRGDAKLLGAIGAWVGIGGLAPVLLIASVSAILATLALTLARRTTFSGQTMIAFGPWIALGGIVVWYLPPLVPL